MLRVASPASSLFIYRSVVSPIRARQRPVVENTALWTSYQSHNCTGKMIRLEVNDWRICRWQCTPQVRQCTWVLGLWFGPLGLELEPTRLGLKLSGLPMHHWMMPRRQATVDDRANTTTIIISPTRRRLPSAAGDVSAQSEPELLTDRTPAACPGTHMFNTHCDWLKSTPFKFSYSLTHSLTRINNTTYYIKLSSKLSK